MGEKLMRVECDPICGFAIQSHDDSEVVNVVMTHAKKAHKMNITAAEVKSKMKMI